MNKTALLPEFKTAPAVFAVGNSYQIMVPVKSEVLFWVTVGDKTFYDHTNGIMRSAVSVHAVTVPMALLDVARSYTVHYRKVVDRTPYFPKSEDTVSATYCFYPVPTDRPINIYQLADTHGAFAAPAAAASYFGPNLDLLVLNGDIPNHCGDFENFSLVYDFCDALTGGEKPVVFSRGNHDMRGAFAEQVTGLSPTDNGNSYFTFRVGGLWGMVLDAGEDKPDSHEAYGYTNACHAFRTAQTDFIRDVIARADREYAAAGVTHRLVLAHHPFSVRLEEPFNIEEDIYTEWTELLAAHVKPHALLAGHIHTYEIHEKGGELDRAGAIPVIVGSRPLRDENKAIVGFVGTAVTLLPDALDVCFTDHTGHVLVQKSIPMKG